MSKHLCDKCSFEQKDCQGKYKSNINKRLLKCGDYLVTLCDEFSRKGGQE